MTDLWRQTGPFFISRAGIEQLKDRIAEKQAELRQTKADIGRHSAADPFLAENPGYQQTKLHATHLPTEIAKLQHILGHAVAIEDTVEYQQLPAGQVGIGCHVTLCFDQVDEETYTILGPTENNSRESTISYLAELAHVIIGRSTGEQVIFKGSQVKIIAASKALG